MPRARRYFVPGYIWHITQRCHKKEFLLKFKRDRLRWKHFLFEAKKRYGLCVLNYIATSNHIHLLVEAKIDGDISKSMQLMAGQTAQLYNDRKTRRGGYWQDRYHATAVESEEHLFRCMVYIDLNMVRAGAVAHPAKWDVAGYHEIYDDRQRYKILDLDRLLYYARVDTLREFRELHAHWIDMRLESGVLKREPNWTEAIAVGSNMYVATMQDLLDPAGAVRAIEKNGDAYVLREENATYE